MKHEETKTEAQARPVDYASVVRDDPGACFSIIISKKLSYISKWDAKINPQSVCRVKISRPTTVPDGPNQYPLTFYCQIHRNFTHSVRVILSSNGIKLMLRYLNASILS